MRRPCIRLSCILHVYRFVYLHLSITLSVCLFVCLSVCLSIVCLNLRIMAQYGGTSCVPTRTFPMRGLGGEMFLLNRLYGYKKRLVMQRRGTWIFKMLYHNPFIILYSVFKDTKGAVYGNECMWESKILYLPLK